MHGEPFSTTSHRTLRARQQQQAFEARRFTGREFAESPAVEALRLPLGSVSRVGFGEVGESVILRGVGQFFRPCVIREELGDQLVILGVRIDDCL